MNDWTTGQIREFIEQAIVSERRLRDALRVADAQSLEAYKKDTAKALEVAKSSADRFMNTLLSLMAIIISIATAAFVYVKH